MRIIDKNHDFYDYLQDPTDTIVFDRRGSFHLTKEMLCDKLDPIRHYWKSKYRFLLLQCGASFWLFFVTITKADRFTGFATDCTCELLDTWKNYDKPNELLKLQLISFKNCWWWDYKTQDYLPGQIRTNTKDLRDAIDQNDIWIERDLSSYTKIVNRKNENIKETQNTPILAPSGIGNLIDPVSIFTAIEECFSIEKTRSETTEAKGATNDDKIVMHGFDTKTSFRGKS